WAPPRAPIVRSLRRIGLATLGLLGAAYGAQLAVTTRLLAAGFGARATAAAALVAAGAARPGAYLLIAALLRAPELSELRTREMKT
ncbi:MAG: hypothetical protein K9N49_09450, partial [Candidatus Marinimicrobia bacterium]|nr:hypothetical protein [Candidatus Neomarinimicrobiota bacterium]